MSLSIDYRALSCKALAAIAIIASIAITFSCTKETLLEVSSTTASLERSAGTSMSVSVTANKPWTATSSASWLTLNAASGEAGTFTINCSYTENPDIHDRMATVTVVCQEVTRTINVTQAGRRLEVSLSDITLTSSAGSSDTMTITTGDAWSMTASGTKSAGWLSIEPSSGAAGTFTITIKATEENTGYDERNAYVTFKVGSVSSIVTVTQKQKDAIILQKDRVEMPAEGGSFDVTLQSNVKYAVTIPESCKSWIGRIQGKGLVSSTESFTVNAGTEDGSREGSIIFSDAASGVSDTLFVFQTQVDKLLLDGETVNAPAAGGSIEVNVKANIDYSAQLVGSPDWLKIATTKAVRQDKIYLLAAANGTYGERSAVLRVTGGSISDWITVTQLQNNALIISRKTVEMPQAGGLFDVEVKSNIKYSYKVEDGIPWIRFTTTKSLVSNVLEFGVYANTGYTDRTAAIVFSSDEDASLKDTVWVNQAKLKHLSIDPRSVTFEKAGGSIEVKVSANVECAATIIKGAEWLAKAASNGQDENAFTFTAAENKDYDPRQAKVAFVENGGTLTDTLTIVQKEATFFSLSKHSAELGSDGGAVEVEANTNLSYSVVIPNDAAWITEAASKGLVKNAHTFSVAPNTTFKSREAAVLFKADTGTTMDTLKIGQAQKDEFRLETGDLSLAAANGEGEIRILSNIGISLSTSFNSGWLTVQSPVSTVHDDGLTEYVYKVKASDNATIAMRSAIVPFKSADGNRTISVSVAQNGAKVYLALESQNAVSVAHEGDNVTVNILTNGSCTSSIPSNASWISRTTKRSNGNSYTESFLVARNSTISSRSAILTFTSVEDNSLSLSVSVTQNGEDAFLTLLTGAQITVASSGQNAFIIFSTNDSFTVAENSGGWITAGTESISGNTVTKSFDFAENEALAERTATIVITSVHNASASASIAVRQRGAEVYIQLSSDAQTMMDAAGGNASVTFKTNGEWGYEISASGSSWITSGQTSVSGKTYTQSFAVAQNGSILQRTSDITFKSKSDGSKSFTVTIIQEGAGIYLTRTSEASVSIAAAGGGTTAILSSNDDFTIETTSAWVTAGTRTVSGTSCTQPFTVAENASTTARTATVTFRSVNDKSITASMSIVQAGADVYFNRTSNAAVSLSASASASTVTWSSNAGCTVSIPSSDTWLTAGTVTQSGTSYSLPLNVSANSSTSSRSAVVTFKSTANSSLSFTVTVTQAGAAAYLTASPASSTIAASGGSIAVSISSNVTVSYTIDGSWIAYSGKSGSTYSFTIAANAATSTRSGSITFSNSGSSPTATVAITQSAASVSTDDHTDGAVKMIYTHTAGNGIPIIIMGDGYSQTDIDNGSFDTHAAKAMDNFFAEEPYTTYQNLFDVYRVEVVSASSGISSNGSSSKLHTYIPDPTRSTEIDVSDNFSGVFSYMGKVGYSISSGNLLVVVIMNDNTYAGTTWMYSNRLSIALCPVIYNYTSTTFAQVMQHESGGHGFGGLADEYGDSGSISESEITDYRNYQSNYEMYMNVDFTSDTTKVLWSKFIYDSRYANDGLGIHEGACTYARGAYRPTNNSIMRDNSGGFNAPSREAIYKEIMKRAYGSSWTYSYEAFVTYDAKNRKTASIIKSNAPSNSTSTDFRPFAPPHIIIK